MSHSPPSPPILTIETFLPLAGQTFVADCQPQAVALELMEVLARPGGGGIGRPPFALIFRSAPDALLAPGLYAMTSDGFGPDAIYIERTSPPATSDGSDGFYYQAIFN